MTWAESAYQGQPLAANTLAEKLAPVTNAETNTAGGFGGDKPVKMGPTQVPEENPPFAKEGAAHVSAP